MNSLMRSINKTHRCYMRYYSEKLKDFGIAGHQQIYIFQVCKRPGITQDGLAKRIAVNKSNVTRQLSNLEEKGYVKRVPSHEDKRSILVYPTQKALDIYPYVLEIMGNWHDTILEDFSDEEKELLLEMMSRVQKKAMAVVQEVEVDD